MPHDIIIKTGTREEAHTLSKKLLDEEVERTGQQFNATGLLGTCENILTGAFGLFAPQNYWINIREKNRFLTIPRTPLWISEDLISGAPGFVVGLGPLGFGFVDPAENRRILRSRYTPRLVEEIHHCGVRYTIEVAEAARRLIDGILESPHIADKILGELDADLFEELIAEILIGHGCDVILTPKTRDRGKDIIAAIPFERGHHISMIECKRRASDSTLGPLEARALLGQFYLDNLQGAAYDAAMLVTTAKKAGPAAAEFDEKVSNFDLRHISDVKRWIQQYGAIRNGLWLPGSLEEML